MPPTVTDRIVVRPDPRHLREVLRDDATPRPPTSRRGQADMAHVLIRIDLCAWTQDQNGILVVVRRG
jgi:hypothetical protein